MILDQRHLGRIVRELLTPRVADIDVLRVAITVQLPQARYGHRAPCSVVVVRAEEIRRTLVSVTCPAESPYAVERKEAPGSVFITDGSRCNGFIGELVARIGKRFTALMSASCHSVKVWAEVIDRNPMPSKEKSSFGILNEFEFLPKVTPFHFSGFKKSCKKL